MNRIEREQTVVKQMIMIYCKKHHNHLREQQLCDDCQALLDYAHKRLSLCPKGNNKTSCRKCEIHCYSADKRAQIKEVMRYVGPRMIFIHPISAIRHIITELR